MWSTALNSIILLQLRHVVNLCSDSGTSTCSSITVSGLSEDRLVPFCNRTWRPYRCFCDACLSPSWYRCSNLKHFDAKNRKLVHKFARACTLWIWLILARNKVRVVIPHAICQSENAKRGVCNKCRNTVSIFPASNTVYLPCCEKTLSKGTDLSKDHTSCHHNFEIMQHLLYANM